MGGVRLPADKQQEIDNESLRDRDSELDMSGASNASAEQRAEIARAKRAREAEGQGQVGEAYCFSAESVGDAECMDIRFPMFPLTGGKYGNPEDDPLHLHTPTNMELAQRLAPPELTPWKTGVRKALEEGLKKAIKDASQREEMLQALKYYDAESADKAIQKFALDLVEEMGEHLLEEAAQGSFKDGITIDGLLNFVRHYPLATAAAAAFAGVKGADAAQGKGTLALKASIFKAKYNVATGEFEVGVRFGFHW